MLQLKLPVVKCSHDSNFSKYMTQYFLHFALAKHKLLVASRDL